jgi:hypothetical protein
VEQLKKEEGIKGNIQRKWKNIKEENLRRW